MRKKARPGRPFTYQEPQDTKTMNLNNSSENNYKSISESLDSGNGGNGRGKKKNNDVCLCWTCRDSRLEDEINSIQKSISKTKEDTNTILNKMKKLEAYFIK